MVWMLYGIQIMLGSIKKIFGIDFIVYGKCSFYVSQVDIYLVQTNELQGIDLQPIFLL